MERDSHGNASPVRTPSAGASPAQASPAGTPPGRASPAQASPAGTPPGRASPAQASPAGTPPGRASPAQASPAGTPPGRASPAQASPARASPAQASPAQAPPVRASPAQVSPVRASPARASPARASPARSSPSRSSSGRSSSARSASVTTSPTRVYLVRATPVGAVPIRSSPARSAPAARATRESPGTSLPKFTWREGQKRLPLIGCVLLLIALVVSLIILFQFWRGHTGIRYKEQRESCPKHAVRCDGVVDCKLKSDELGCVRFDWDKSLLKIYSGSSHQWLPICSSNWNDSYSEKTCQQLGFESAYRTTEVAHRDFANSFSISRYNSTIQESLHRTREKVLEGWKVYAGTSNLHQLPEAVSIAEIIINSNYTDEEDDYDIALMRLSKPLTLSAHIHPACLPMHGQTFSLNETCWITGFGKTRETDDKTSPFLREVQVNLIDFKKCNDYLVYDSYLTPRMMCAGDLRGGRDSCQGDSGGPLVCEQNNRWYLAGVTSWGTGCGQRNKPGVYTKVTEVLPWIYSKMESEVRFGKS
ncbi:transmembrane protease serine 13 isoform X4 [Macaca fascicularis]|uniref:transmembrane protease serine 13 isoform X4 n=1 Tax=Macaca fascicularis TaxID=9541 RepID=UPI003D156912